MRAGEEEDSEEAASDLDHQAGVQEDGSLDHHQDPLAPGHHHHEVMDGHQEDPAEVIPNNSGAVEDEHQLVAGNQQHLILSNQPITTI